jgi:resolvase-like protein
MVRIPFPPARSQVRTASTDRTNWQTFSRPGNCDDCARGVRGSCAHLRDGRQPAPLYSAASLRLCPGRREWISLVDDGSATVDRVDADHLVLGGLSYGHPLQWHLRPATASARHIGSPGFGRNGGAGGGGTGGRSASNSRSRSEVTNRLTSSHHRAGEQGYSVPDDWVIEDEGFSGASLLRPGLERLRDLAAEGHIQAVLIHSPDRLSRKYAYQVLLTEEFARHGSRQSF